MLRKKSFRVGIGCFVTAVAAVSGPAVSSEVGLAAALLGEAQDGLLYSGTHIVRMAGAPAATYSGDSSGLPATAPLPGKKFNAGSQAVGAYTAHLLYTQEQACDAARIDPTQVLYHYTYSFNGFAAKLTADQRAALEARDDVLDVWRSERAHIDTDNTPDFLGLDDPSDGLVEALGLTGKDVIIGMIDTGIWPEHPSFADTEDDEGTDDEHSDDEGSDDLHAYGPPPATWRGVCQLGEGWTEQHCTGKIIGARYFAAGFQVEHTLIPEEFVSARDSDGHGSHTAGTAGGNVEIEASVAGQFYGVIRGVAPRARIAVYKGCWAGISISSGAEEFGSCDTSDLMMAIDAAVADGVDVISYSISSGTDPVSPVEIAFFNAALAGVFVSKSAGNAGPLPRTVRGISPWITTVAASTHDRGLEGHLETLEPLYAEDPPSQDDEGSDDEGSDERGSLIAGQSQTGGIGFRRLVDAEDAGSELCTPDELVPELVADRIVLCKWGEIPNVDKSLAVKLAGGAGMVLYNDAAPAPQDLVAQVHYVPSLHVAHEDGLELKAYVDAAGDQAEVRLLGTSKIEVEAPWMASFSSRGGTIGAEDILKPDLTAPGVRVLAARSPAPGPQATASGAPGQHYGFLNGTSMSTPHVAGAAALLREAYPDWTPAMIKSALMTTAQQGVLKEGGQTPADPLDFGAGHLTPNPAIAPGLVYDAGAVDYCAYLCGAVPGPLVPSPCECDALPPGLSRDASDLNLASIAVASLLGEQTVTRRIRNVGPAATYQVSVENPPGYEFVVTPDILTLGIGETQSYSVRITATPGPDFGRWGFGSLTWSDGDHEVRSPVVVRGDELVRPDVVTGEGSSGSTSYELTAAFDGRLTSQPAGLVEPTLTTMVIEDDPTNDLFTAFFTGVGFRAIPVFLPPGTKHFRAAIFDEYTSGNDELNLVLAVPGDGPIPTPIDIDFSPGSTEEVNLAFAGIPPEGLTVFVAIWALETEGPDTEFTLFQWLVTGDEGNLSVSAPSQLSGTVTETVTLEWAGLEPGTAYLGGVLHGLESGTEEFVLLEVDSGEPLLAVPRGPGLGIGGKWPRRRSGFRRR